VDDVREALATDDDEAGAARRPPSRETRQVPRG
jgi:hypothetical protein